MADSRFKIEKKTELLNVKRNIPLFLSNKSQLLKDEATKSHSIASITQTKKMKVLKHNFLSLRGSLNKFGQLHLFFAIFLLPLVQKNSAAVNSVWTHNKNVIILYL